MTGWVCTAGITIKVLNPSRSKGFAAAPAVEIWRAIVAKAAEELVRRDRRFADSPLEQSGFELSVPLALKLVVSRKRELDGGILIGDDDGMIP
jgi:hypothetical protein